MGSSLPTQMVDRMSVACSLLHVVSRACEYAAGTFDLSIWEASDFSIPSEHPRREKVSLARERTVSVSRFIWYAWKSIELKR